MIFAYILTSLDPAAVLAWLNRIQRFLYDVCEPYLRLFRRVLPPLGPIDLSPMVGVIVSDRRSSSSSSRLLDQLH